MNQRRVAAVGRTSPPARGVVGGAVASAAGKAPARKRTPKAREGNGQGGTVKTRAAIKCGEKGCGEVFANAADASKHLVEAHPKS